MNPFARNSDVQLLHPSFRSAVTQLLEQLNAENIPFRLFEGFRSPDRQADLYAQGRTKPGNIVTYALPWRSYHQYGLGADFVLFEDGKWSWDTKGPKAKWWNRLHEVGKQLGLASLDFELPHLQLSGTSSNALSEGRYPSDGDVAWAENLAASILAWKGDPAAPKLPIEVPARPAIA